MFSQALFKQGLTLHWFSNIDRQLGETQTSKMQLFQEQKMRTPMAHSDFLTCSKTCTENSNGSRNMCRPKKNCERQLALHVVSLRTGKRKPTLAKNQQIRHDHFKKYFCRIEHSSQKTQKVMKMKALYD